MFFWFIINSRGFRKSEAAVGAAPGIIGRASGRAGNAWAETSAAQLSTDRRTDGRGRRRSTARGFPHLSIIERDEGNHLFEGAAVRRRGALYGYATRGLHQILSYVRTTKKLFVIPSLAAQAVEKGHKAINVNWTDVSTLHRQRPCRMAPHLSRIALSNA